MYKKILLTGVSGQVGHALQQFLANHSSPDNTILSLDRSQLDLSNQDEIRRVIQIIKPDLIINPAAYTAVDKAEIEPELAYAINAIAPQILAEEAEKIGAAMIHFSTEYVYNGAKSGAYVEDDPTDPLCVYGKSKLAGEDAIRAVGLPHLIFRTTWVYGAHGRNFFKTMLRLAMEQNELRVVADQIGAPTNSYCIAEAISQVLKTWKHDLSGVYHLVNTGQTSWHGFATAIVNEYTQLQENRGWTPLKVNSANIQAIATTEFHTLAARPANSYLNCNKLATDFSIELPHWHQALVTELNKFNPLQLKTA